MLVLVGLSIVLLIAFLSAFIFWSFRDERVSSRSIRTWFLTGVIAFTAIFIVFT
jgi:hypothetical protein